MKTRVESTAKPVFLDSTNLGVGPVSRVTLDQFVYVGDVSGQTTPVDLIAGQLSGRPSFITNYALTG